MMKEDLDKLKVVKTNTIYAADPINKSLLMLHAWTNLEGFEVNLAGEHSFQHISLTYNEFDLLKKMVKKLRKTSLS